MSAKLELALISCALLGLRHGFDYDHLAAITDITSVQRGWREGMRLGFLYALGHACTIAVLGVAVVVFRLALPVHLDAVGERVVGVTLLVLTGFILLAFVRRAPGSHAHPSSRIALLISGARQLHWKVRSWRNPALPRPIDFRFQYGEGSVFTIGILHGLGAETPSQLVLFLLAANLGGTSRGIFGLLCFILGLLTMNTLMTASASGIFASAVRQPRVQTAITLLTAAYSLVIGLIYASGVSDRLPALVR